MSTFAADRGSRNTTTRLLLQLDRRSILKIYPRCCIISDLLLVSLPWPELDQFVHGTSQVVVWVSQNQSSIFDCKHSLPQGSVLGPMLFTPNAMPLTQLITFTSHGKNHTQYADDVQLYIILMTLQLHPCCAAASKQCNTGWLSTVCVYPEKTEAMAVDTSARQRTDGVNSTRAVFFFKQIQIRVF